MSPRLRCLTQPSRPCCGSGSLLLEQHRRDLTLKLTRDGLLTNSSAELSQHAADVLRGSFRDAALLQVDPHDQTFVVALLDK